MPIDVSVPRSPGWWMEKLSVLLTDPRRQRRLKLLDSYRKGYPPLPSGADNCREGFAAFLRLSRTNLAPKITKAIRERMVPIGIRTSADGDETGDQEAWRIWLRSGQTLQAISTHDDMLSLGEGYVIVGDVDPDTQVPVITSESPMQMIGIPDPARPGKLLAALKMFHDRWDLEDRAYLYLPGEVWVAVADRRGPSMTTLPRFNSQTWSMDLDASGALPPELAGVNPAVGFFNEHGLGEYEPHLDLLDRINHTMLQRLVVTAMQAFRQRAVEGLPDTDEQGAEIDYTDVFTSDPGALWQVPAGVKFWESAAGDLTPILMATKDDLQMLCAVTELPMAMFTPDGANQTAEGASTSKEGLNFRVADRITRVNESWSSVQAIGFRWMGDLERADLSKLAVIWRSPDRRSLTERADAASKATDVPWRTKMIKIWEFSPDEVDRMEVERASDMALAAAFAQPGPAAPAPAPAPAVAGGNV